jgi:hypothetical protein
MALFQRGDIVAVRLGAVKGRAIRRAERPPLLA